MKKKTKIFECLYFCVFKIPWSFV